MKAQLKNHNGTPTVFLDDKPVFFGCHLIGYMDPKNLEGYQPIVRRYAQAGIHIYSIDTLPLDWVGPREGNPSPFDFTSSQPRMRTILDADPDALFLIRGCLELYWPPTDWWVRRTRTKRRSSRTAPSPGNRPPRRSGGGRRANC